MRISYMEHVTNEEVGLLRTAEQDSFAGSGEIRETEILDVTRHNGLEKIYITRHYAGHKATVVKDDSG